MVTRRPLLESSAPRELAVRPLPSDDTTPPVTKTNFVGWELGRRGPRSRGSASRPTDAHVNTHRGGADVGNQSRGVVLVTPARLGGRTRGQPDPQRPPPGRRGRRAPP